MTRITRWTSRFPPRPFGLTAREIIALRESGQLHRLLCITEDEINDKSKSNLFVKAIAATNPLDAYAKICSNRAKPGCRTAWDSSDSFFRLRRGYLHPELVEAEGR